VQKTFEWSSQNLLELLFSAVSAVSAFNVVSHRVLHTKFAASSMLPLPE
jgi:hypothetical protein